MNGRASDEGKGTIKLRIITRMIQVLYENFYFIQKKNHMSENIKRKKKVKISESK